ncbi:MAG: NAD-dependent epimerase/dehydratase family protein [Planctomycetota bacterium]
MSDSKVLISGGTGFVGAALVDALPNVAVFSRDPVRARASLERRLDREVSCFAWAGGRTRPPQEAFEGVETVVHLAGKSVDTRWSETQNMHVLRV